MNAENEASEPYEEPTVPQYQIQLENLDFELKKLKGELFILEQKHFRNQILIKSKLESAKRASENHLEDLEKVKHKDSSSKVEKSHEINQEINEVEQKKTKVKEKINQIKESLNPKFLEQDIKYERMSMLENDIQSTEVEKKKLEEEILSLDKKTEELLKTYPESFKTLTDDFILFDKKSRIEIQIKQIEDKINLQNFKVKEFQEIKASFDKLTSSKNENTDNVEIKLKLKLNEQKQKKINDLINSLGKSVNQIIQIEKYFNMFEALFQNKDYINNQISANAVKNIIIPFISDLLENYSEINNNQLDVIEECEKELEDFNDIKPTTMQIKRDVRLKHNKLNEEKNFLEYLQKLIKICENLKEKKWWKGGCPMGGSDENDFFENLKEMISLSSEATKEEVEQLFEEYLNLKEAKEREYFYLMGGHKEANTEFDEIKQQANSYNDIVIRHKKEIEDLNKEKKLLQNELKALNDTINLRSRELKNSLSQYNEEEFSDYFNNNKALLKLLLFKEKKSIVKNNQYELTKENIHENVLIDHSRKKMNMYTYLKRKYFLEYLYHLYTEDNLDYKNMNERTQKAFKKLTTEINDSLQEINTYKEELNNCDNQMTAKKEEKQNKNYIGNNSVYQLNEKLSIIKNNINVLDEQKNQEQREFEMNKSNYEIQINKLMQEIEELEEQLNNKLNRMTDGIVNLYLKYDYNTSNYNPDKDKFIPVKYGYSQREFNFSHENQMLYIKDMRNNIIEKKIKYDMIKRISLEVESYKLVEEIEKKYYKDEREKNKDPKCKKKIKFFVVLRRNNLDLIAKEYNDYKRFADIVNSIIIHK